MNATPQFFISETRDAFRNIATEEFLVENVRSGEVILFLWRNDNTIVIGRNQNPWKECRVAEFEQAGGKIARRRSGGGAVFHDGGNLNFTFIARDADFDIARHMETMRAAVRSFGLDAQLSGRNDVTVDGAKFSGNAFFRSGDKRCHHGTLMIGVDTALLGRYLIPDQKKLKAKGIESVRSRVVNLGDLSPRITVETLSVALLEAFNVQFGHTAEPLSAERLDENSIAERTARFASWDWRFGTAVPFTHTLETRHPWGNLDIELAVAGGVIKHANISSDALDADFIVTLACALCDCRYESSAVAQRLAVLATTTPEQETMLADCLSLLHQGF